MRHLRSKMIYCKKGQPKMIFSKNDWQPLWMMLFRPYKAAAGPVVSLSHLTLVSGMPTAAGCEGNLLPEAAGGGPFLCQRLPDVSVVVLLGC